MEEVEEPNGKPIVKWAGFCGNEEIENRLSRTKGKVF